MAEPGGPRLPTRNGMPDLADLDLDGLLYAFKAQLTGRLTRDRGHTYEDQALLTNLARLVDRALADYAAASQRLDVWIADRRQLGARFAAVTALETSIAATARACRVATRLADRGVVDPAQLPTGGDAAAVKEMRDAIEHTEDRLLGERPPPIERGQYPFLAFGDDDVALGSHWLTYRTLADVLTALHRAVRSPVRSPID